MILPRTSTHLNPALPWRDVSQQLTAGASDVFLEGSNVIMLSRHSHRTRLRRCSCSSSSSCISRPLLCGGRSILAAVSHVCVRQLPFICFLGKSLVSFLSSFSAFLVNWNSSCKLVEHYQTKVISTVYLQPAYGQGIAICHVRPSVCFHS